MGREFSWQGDKTSCLTLELQTESKENKLELF